jgi:hypothetical protein
MKVSDLNFAPALLFVLLPPTGWTAASDPGSLATLRQLYDGKNRSRRALCGRLLSDFAHFTSQKIGQRQTGHGRPGLQLSVQRIGNMTQLYHL